MYEPIHWPVLWLLFHFVGQTLFQITYCIIYVLKVEKWAPIVRPFLAIKSHIKSLKVFVQSVRSVNIFFCPTDGCSLESHSMKVIANKTLVIFANVIFEWRFQTIYVLSSDSRSIREHLSQILAIFQIDLTLMTRKKYFAN